MNAPRGTLTPALSEQIAKHKKEIIGFLQRANARLEISGTPIPHIDDHQPSPLSFAQERLWLLEQLEPGRSVYNLTRAVRITGPLDIGALESSLSKLIRRHESLRTKFVAVEGRPLQCATAHESLRLNPTDLSALLEEERKEQTTRLLLKEARQPFDLSGDRLFRLRLLKEHDDVHVLIFCMHHMISDAWSMGIVLHELWSLYKDFVSGSAPTLPELTVRYREYAVWQRRQLQGDVLEAHLAYWKQQLADAPYLDLSMDRPRPATQGFHGGRQPLELPPALTAALNDLSKREGVTLFMTLLAAFQLLLYRHTGQEDIIVAAPVANREQRGIEGVIGFFVNTIALRVNLSGQPSFKELLRRAREVCLCAYAHQAAPFEKVVAALNPRRELNRNPIFQTMLVLQNTPRRPANPPGIRLESIEIDNQTAQFDLSLYLREREGKLLGFIEYSVDLFDAATIARMAGHYHALLENAVADPDRSIATMPMLSVPERRQLLVEWNNTAAEYPRDTCIHELFEAQVERTPEAIALELENERLTYRDLNGRGNRLAYELKELGVGPGKLVGVMVERSFEMVTSLLAILKTGGAYVPLDPGYPTERLKFMIADAEIAILLTQRKFAHRIAARGPTLFVDEPRRRESKRAANSRNRVAADSPAYVIYTSGSTGTPKGVVALHRGAVNRFTWMWKTYPFKPDEKNCLKTSLSFVDSVWEIFGALLRGVPTVIVPELTAKDPERLVGYLAQHRVTRLVVVPSLLREILAQCHDPRKHLSELKFCFSSGEPLTADLATRFRQARPGCKLVNLYGSSEVSADVTCSEIDDGSPGSTISIGRPIHNTQIYLLDSHMQPVPVGARGELYVGGDSLARGYLKRPKLTAEKFVANPFSVDTDSRLFRTGDMARYRADGDIESLGRADDQVKIRGCRIELSEIEAALDHHPAIRESAVALRELTAAEPNGRADLQAKIQNSKFATQLLAYVVAIDQAGPAARELRSFLRAKLPDYMVPGNFIWLEKLPLLPNGKIDRRALPPSGDLDGCNEGTVMEPRTEIEILIGQIWQEILRIDNVGVEDNFFDLGGHSLLAAQVAARMRAVFHKPVALRDLFESPTIAGLAPRVERVVRPDQEKDLPAITPVPGKGAVGLSFGQKQLFLFGQLFGGADFLNMPYAYRLEGRVDVAALKKAIQEVVNRHDPLRTAFIDTADGARQVVRRRLTVKLSIVDLARLPKKKRDNKLDEISKRDAARTFDLEKPPLFRTTLLRLADDQYTLLVTMHHIISDQWSMGVFRKELAALYEAFTTAMPSPLPALPFQYSDFITWQKQLLKSGAFERQIAYWRQRLDELAPALEFRREPNLKSAPRFHSARQPMEFTDDLVARIKSFARSQNCTPFMVFVTALDVLLYRWTGETDIRIGTLVANRGQAGTDGLIGYFVNALVLRTRVLPAMTCVEVLRDVRETCLGAYAHQDVPFEYLETLLAKKRKRARPPLYQVMFNYRNLWTPTLKSNGLTIASWNGKNRASDPGIAMARLDVNFHLHEMSTKFTGAVNYKTDLFDRSRIAKLLADYSAILKQMIAYPKRRIAKIAVSQVGRR